MNSAASIAARRAFCLVLGASAFCGTAAKTPRAQAVNGPSADRSASEVARLPADLPVRDLDGASSRLPSAGNQLRVVNFWARWCAPCRRELPSLQRLADRLGDRRRTLPTSAIFAVQAVALDDDAFALREYWRGIGLTRLGVWRLAPADAPASLGLTALPLTLIVGRGGQIVERVRGAREWDADDWVARLLRLAAREAQDA